MKNSVFGLCILGFASLSGAVQAQCGCGSGYYAQTAMRGIAPMTYSSPMAHSSSTAVGSISYVNKLNAPVDRGTYTLNYAVHLTNGRTLYMETMPSGFSVRGTEAYRSGKKAISNVGTDGKLSVSDPSSNQLVAIIQQ